MFFCSINYWIKGAKLICNLICLSLIASFHKLQVVHFSELTPFQKYYLIVASSFLILSALGFLYYFCSVIHAKFSTKSFKNIHICVNVAAGILYIAAGIGLLQETCRNNMCGSELKENETYYPDIALATKMLIAAGSMALVNTLLYLADAFIIIRTDEEKYEAVRLTYNRDEKTVS